MPTNLIVTLALLTLSSLPGRLPAAESTLTYSSGQKAGNLLELYTSEGCSSCPPADVWLSTLKHDRRLWTEIIPVSFHVDYWDTLGWKDRFASPEFSRRQRIYAISGHTRSVYTPGFFYNGEEWSGFFDGIELPVRRPRPTGHLRVTIYDDLAAIHFSPTTDHQRFDVHLAVLGFDLVSRIRRGENSGKTLHHDFVALSYSMQPLKPNDDDYSIKVRLPDRDYQTERLGLAVWVTARGNPVPLQAVGGWLNKPMNE